MDLTVKEASAVAAAITRLEEGLTATKKWRFDGKEMPVPSAPTDAATLTYSEMTNDLKWLSGAPRPGDDTAASVSASWEYLTEARPVATPRPETDYHYREPLMMQLVLKDGKGTPIGTKAIAFAQWGTPRKLPMTAPLFGTLDSTFVFAQDGSLIEATVITSARGAAAASAFTGAADSAKNAADSVSKARAANSELARLQAEDELLKAKIDLINNRNTLISLGGTP
jgi:hypothetical protein